MFDFLKNRGTLISVMPSGLGINSSKKSRLFDDWLKKLDYDVQNLPPDTFKDSGTRIETELLTIRK
jgi:hypothetical protein